MPLNFYKMQRFKPQIGRNFFNQKNLQHFFESSNFFRRIAAATPLDDATGNVTRQMRRPYLCRKWNQVAVGSRRGRRSRTSPTCCDRPADRLADDPDIRSRLHHTSHGSVSVVRTTFKVYGKMQTLTLSQPKTPEPIVTKF